MSYDRKYGVATHVYVPIIKRAVVDFAVSADWTPAAGDVKISKDGGAAANVTNLPTAIAMGNTAMWDFSLTATEMQAAKIKVTVADSATKAVEDQFFDIATYGNASAEYPGIDLTDTSALGIGRLDAAISSRLASASYTAPPTAAAVSDQVWDEATADHVISGSTGKRLADIATGTPPTADAIADAVWDEATAGHSTPSTFGSLVLGIDALLNLLYTDIQTNLGSVLNILGIQGGAGFSGTGTSTVFGFFRALFRKDYTVPTDIGGTYDPATDSLEALAERDTATQTTINNIETTTNTINSTTTIISGGATTVTVAELEAQLQAAEAGHDTLGMRQADTWTQPIIGLGTLTGRDKCYFTVKLDRSDADADALVQIEETAGLVRLNGTAATAGQGSLTVTDATTGALTLVLAAVATAALTPGVHYHYSIKIVTGTTATTKAEGKLRILQTTTLAVS